MFCVYTQNICLTFVQCRPSVYDVGPTLYKCYTNVLCLRLRLRWADIVQIVYKCIVCIRKTTYRRSNKLMSNFLDQIMRGIHQSPSAIDSPLYQKAINTGTSYAGNSRLSSAGAMMFPFWDNVSDVVQELKQHCVNVRPQLTQTVTLAIVVNSE